MRFFLTFIQKCSKTHTWWLVEPQKYQTRYLIYFWGFLNKYFTKIMKPINCFHTNALDDTHSNLPHRQPRNRWNPAVSRNHWKEKKKCKGLGGTKGERGRGRNIRGAIISMCRRFVVDTISRPDTRLPQSRAGGQGPYLRSLERAATSSEAKDLKNKKKVMCDRRTDKAGCRVA